MPQQNFKNVYMVTDMVMGKLVTATKICYTLLLLTTQFV